MDARSEPPAVVTGGARAGFGRSIRGLLADAVSGTVGISVGVTGRLRLGRDVRTRANGIGRTDRDGPALLKAVELAPTDDGPMEDELVASGRFVRIETRGERSGLARPVTVGFVEDEAYPGALLVAAGSAETSWARNLLADPSCLVTTGDRSFEAIAEPLAGADHARTVRELILRYGTPAEGLGHGTSFRLRPATEGTA